MKKDLYFLKKISNYFIKNYVKFLKLNALRVLFLVCFDIRLREKTSISLNDKCAERLKSLLEIIWPSRNSDKYLKKKLLEIFHKDWYPPKTWFNECFFCFIVILSAFFLLIFFFRSLIFHLYFLKLSYFKSNFVMYSTCNQEIQNLLFFSKRTLNFSSVSGCINFAKLVSAIRKRIFSLLLRAFLI